MNAIFAAARSTEEPRLVLVSESYLWPGCAYLTLYRFDGIGWAEQRPVSLN